MFAEKFRDKSDTELFAEATRRAREISEVLTEAHRRGFKLAVSTDHVKVGGQGEFVQLMVQIVRLPG